MTDTTDQQEPTMEEILSSIRRIINEEGDEESEAVSAGADSDEIPTFQPAAEPEPEPQPEPEPKAESEPVAEDEILELTEFAEDPQDEGTGSPPPDTIVSDETVSQTHQSLSELSALMVAGYEGADNTLEGLVRELLKPMLQAYLDENLPRIAEELVAKEIARISRGG